MFIFLTLFVTGHKLSHSPSDVQCHCVVKISYENARHAECSPVVCLGNATTVNGFYELRMLIHESGINAILNDVLCNL